MPFYVALGTSLAEEREDPARVHLDLSVAVIPGALILGSLLGWFMAGRALTPVLEVAQAAQRISGSNLSLRIPTRQAGDELDYLILTFNRMIERLEASFRQMRQFSADVSHELRTPITAIRGQLEVALVHRPDHRTIPRSHVQRAAGYRPPVANRARAAAALASRIRPTGAAEVAARPRDGGGRPGRAVPDSRRSAPACAWPRTCRAECFVEADRVQIERMITNLLSNALKFTPEGGEVRMPLAAPTGRRVELVVEDTGRGIPTEHLPHIFDRFYRVPGSGHRARLPNKAWDWA